MRDEPTPAGPRAKADSAPRALGEVRLIAHSQRSIWSVPSFVSRYRSGVAKIWGPREVPRLLSRAHF